MLAGGRQTRDAAGQMLLAQAAPALGMLLPSGPAARGWEHHESLGMLPPVPASSGSPPGTAQTSKPVPNPAQLLASITSLARDSLGQSSPSLNAKNTRALLPHTFLHPKCQELGFSPVSPVPGRPQAARAAKGCRGCSWKRLVPSASSNVIRYGGRSLKCFINPIPLGC